jgi:hypothetical protein
MTLKLPNGVYTYVGFVPMHRRHRRGIYRRTSDWLAHTSTVRAARRWLALWR